MNNDDSDVYNDYNGYDGNKWTTPPAEVKKDIENKVIPLLLCTVHSFLKVL